MSRQPLHRVQAALLLGTARRLFRSDDSEPLTPIRSIRFFLPIVDELRIAGVQPGYLEYLAGKIADATGSELVLDQPQPGGFKYRTPRQLELPWD